MTSIYNKSVIILVIILAISCSQVGNNETAFVFNENHKTYIELTGKRKPMVHDLFSVFTSGLIDDTLILQIPELKDGTIMGKDIPVEEDANKYKGYINIDKTKLVVSLQLIDVGAKKVYEESYNGIYELKKKEGLHLPKPSEE